jgi:lipoate-protein ligase B
MPKDRDTCIYLNCGRVGYEAAWRLQRELVQLRRRGEVPDMLLLLEHPDTITIGKTGGESHLLTDADELRRQGVALVHTDRGGDITYHGPGQLVGYPILDLNGLKKDIFWYLRQLEQVVIDVLSQSDIAAGRKEGLTGVWVGEGKIAAIGVKVSHWITSHGFAFNIAPRMQRFELIVPCGIAGKAVIAMSDLIGAVGFDAVTTGVVGAFGEVFARRMMPYNHASWPALTRALDRHEIGQPLARDLRSA